MRTHRHYLTAATRAALVRNGPDHEARRALMRVRNLLLSIIALAAVHGAEVATAQNLVTFTVDGDWRDWSEWGPTGPDDYHDVTPDTNSTVDIVAYEYGYGKYGPIGDNAPPQRELFAFIFEFLAPPFQGSDPTTVDLFFDVSPDTTFGDRTSPWEPKGFRPDYRFTVTGQGGRLTRESYRRYTGGQWNAPTEGADITELEVALSGKFLEGAIPWTAVGSPAPDAGPDKPEVRTYAWAAEVSKGTYREYVPDVPYFFSHYLTAVESLPWGMVKNLRD